VEDEEIPTSPLQVTKVVQGNITMHESSKTKEKENRLMLSASTIQFLFPVLHSKNPILELCRRMVYGGQ